MSMKKTRTPTVRLTLAELHKQGWLAEVVEKRLPRLNISKDLFGFLDILAIKDGCTLGVQVTSGSNVGSHVKKITSAPALGMVLKAGWRVELHGWRKVKLKRGGRKEVYRCRVIRIEIATPDATNVGGFGVVED